MPSDHDPDSEDTVPLASSRRLVVLHRLLEAEERLPHPRRDVTADGP
jgi:hypothetical protein